MSKRFWGMLSCLFASLLALYLFCFNKSSGMTVNAALSGGKFLTPDETRSAFGEQITGRYYDGSGYTDIIFYYSSVGSISTSIFYDTYKPDIISSGNQGLIYTASNVVVNTNPQFITFDIRPEFSLLNTSQIHASIALSGGGNVSNTVYSPPRWEWNINGIQTIYQASGGAGASYPNLWPSFYVNSERSNGFSYVAADYSSNAPISGYSIRASFFGNIQSAQDGNTYRLFIGCPYVSSDASGQIGTLPAVTTFPAPSYTVIVDNAGVESRLDNVVSAVDDLGNIIQDDGNYDYGSPDEVIENAPSGVDEEAIEDAMSKADTILDDIPSIVATGAFWMNCAKDLVNDNDFIVIVPVCILLSFIIYIWWKK